MAPAAHPPRSRTSALAVSATRSVDPLPAGRRHFEVREGRLLQVNCEVSEWSEVSESEVKWSDAFLVLYFSWNLYMS